jgi:hypothetical protein
MKKDPEQNDSNQSNDSYSVATLRMGKTDYFVDLEPFSPHGGPVYIGERDKKGRSYGSGYIPEEVERNRYLMKILKKTNTVWLLDLCRQFQTPTQLLVAFKLEFENRNGRPPEKRT